MADDKNKPGDNADDKNINDLLSEYADLKDEDLQDFLKGTDSEDSFVLDDEEQAAAATEERRKSSLLPVIVSVVILGAAAGGAYYFISQKGGLSGAMESVRASVPGMSGSDEPVSAPMMAYDEPGTTGTPASGDLPVPGADSMPPSADTTAPITNADSGVATWPEADTGAPSNDNAVPGAAPVPAVAGDVVMPEPMPIVNEATIANAPVPADSALPASPEVATPDTVTAAEPLPVPASEDDAAALGATPAPAPVPAEITSWERAADQPAPLPEAVPEIAPAPAPVPVAEPAPAAVPEKDVAALKATPPTNAAEPKAKKTAKKETSSDAAPRKAKSPAGTSAFDGALPPPFMAIRSGNGPAAAGATGDQGTVYVSSAGVSNGGTGTPMPVQPNTVSPVTENVNHSQPDLSSANPYYDVIRQGGGMVEMVNGKVVTAATPTTQAQPAPQPAQQQAAPAAPAGRIAVPASPGAPDYDAVANARSQLVTAGGRSYPVKDGASLAAMSQPTASELAARQIAGTPSLADGPVPTAPKQVAPAPAAQAAPAAPVASGVSAPAILQQAMQAEKAGKAADAIALYQKALEVDAVVGGGTSIDRGMVYDRIAALRGS